jgi:hypothetical protein
MDMLKSQSFFSKSRLLPAPTECNISSLSSDPSKSAVAFQDNSELSLTFRERDRTSPVRKSALVVADHTENPDAVTRRTKLLDVRDSNRADFISDVDYMILLFQSLGVSKIPRILFERARSPQFRWTESGCQVQLTALQAGLDQQLIDLLLDDARLARTIHELNRLSKLSTPMTGPWYCSVDSSLSMELCQSLSEQIRGEWRVKLLNWICFVFPRDQFWEPQ